LKVAENYKDLREFNRFKVLTEYGLNLLKETLQDFLNCEVSFHFRPSTEAKEKFNIAVLESPKRGCYPINEETFYIFARILEAKNLISGLGIILSGKNISKQTKILNVLEGALTGELSKSFFDGFDNCSLILGDNLITHAICNYCIRGYIDYRRFHHALNYFLKLKNTTFESESFSTGMIITKSFHSYNKKSDEERAGTLFPLVKNIRINDSLKPNRRFWYLADGKHSFFVANKHLDIANLFVLDENYSGLDYLDSNTLSLTLKGGDVLFRVENQKQFSIISSDGVEFLCLENRWQVRDYKLIKNLISKVIKEDEIINAILFYILYCSKNSISSVIWVPKNIETIEKYVKPETLNKLIEKPISIIDKRLTSHIMRYLSSDGASIIDSSGFLNYFGCIVDMKDLEIKGVKGTGESAAQVLSSNGMSIKISQDGTIKLFIEGNETAVIV
jgi:hypothetical protein